MGKVYKTMQGKSVDMEKLMSQNELMPAVGNAKVNARGDELGKGGKIIKKREDIVSEYYDSNPNAIPEDIKPVRTKSTDAPQKQQVVGTENGARVEAVETKTQKVVK